MDYLFIKIPKHLLNIFEKIMFTAALHYLQFKLPLFLYICKSSRVGGWGGASMCLLFTILWILNLYGTCIYVSTTHPLKHLRGDVSKINSPLEVFLDQVTFKKIFGWSSLVIDLCATHTDTQDFSSIMLTRSRIH
jgi:hypothetical protein